MLDRASLRIKVYRVSTNVFAFLRPSVIKASEVGPRSAVIMWKTPTVVYHSYRVIYQVAREEKKVT